VLSRGPTENGHRPAINALFRSAAVAYGPRCIGVLLSGVLDNGVLGLDTIRSHGGVTIAQTPQDALFPAMPNNARAAGVLDCMADAADIGSVLERLAQRPIEDHRMERDLITEMENRIAMARPFSAEFDTQDIGPPSGYTCPDCHGSLVVVGETNFRCRVGHAWTPESLLIARDGEAEAALWVAVRSLQEKAKLARELASRVTAGALSRRYSDIAGEAEQALTVLTERIADTAEIRTDGA